jgi:rare lipoprotein A (peptidoglycan hydrolase)
MAKAAMILAVLTSSMATQTTARAVPHKPFSTMTTAQIASYQKRVIAYDQWVIRTRSVHLPHVVWWHRQQLKWTTRELKETLARLRPANVHYSSGMSSRTATWYGPGFYYHGTSCGQTYKPGSRWIAAAGMSCGTPVTICYHGRCVRTSVQDSGGAFDMTNGVVYALCGCYNTLTVQYKYG